MFKSMAEFHKFFLPMQSPVRCYCFFLLNKQDPRNFSLQSVYYSLELYKHLVKLCPSLGTQFMLVHKIVFVHFLGVGNTAIMSFGHLNLHLLWFFQVSLCIMLLLVINLVKNLLTNLITEKNIEEEKYYTNRKQKYP